MSTQLLEYNKRLFDLSGITEFHNAGFTGQGMKIAVMDSICDITHPIYKGKVALPFNDEFSKDSFSHGGAVCQVAIRAHPDAEIFLMKCDAKAMQWCIDNHVDVINVSRTIGSTDPEFHRLAKVAIEKEILLFTSAGNIAKRGLGALAKNPDWIAVGALRLYNQGKDSEYIARADYSSYGDINDEVWSSVEITSFSGVFIQSPVNQEGFQFMGTSCSSPMMAGMAALLKERRHLTQQTMRDSFSEYAVDLGIKGYDAEYGYGMFVLPKEVDVAMKRTHIVIHNTGAWEKDAQQVKDYHLSEGYRDVGYNYLIEYDGRIVTGRPLNIAGAHTRAGNMNTLGIGIAVLGNLDQKEMTLAQHTSLVELIDNLMIEHDIPIDNVLGHKEVEGSITTCPGKYTDMSKLRGDLVAKILLMDVPSKVENGRTLVPLRAFAEAFGVFVHYDKGIVTMTQNDTKITHTIGTDKMVIE